MKMVKFFSMLLMVVMCVSFVGCSNDDDEVEVISTSIVGEWYRETKTQSITYKFNSNLTGSYLEVNRDEYGEETTRNSENFEYTLSETAEGLKYVRMVFESSSIRVRYDVTASKLLIYSSSGDTYSEFKRR